MYQPMKIVFISSCCFTIKTRLSCFNVKINYFNLILDLYCPNITQILFKYYPNIILILSKYFPNNVKYIIQNNVLTLSKYFPDIILSKYYQNIVQISSKYYQDIVNILTKTLSWNCSNIVWMMLTFF